MIAAWERVEPLLARVHKPACYIGYEDGAATPQHCAGQHSARTVAWLLADPETYEIGLPNQGLQILDELVNERDNDVADRRDRAVARPSPAEARRGCVAVQRGRVSRPRQPLRWRREHPHDLKQKD